ncbi:hypothetical protein [Rhodobacter sp. NSM]|uniref:hypothetical protein n=1 Tax=Rhodobacter sp. NSM TaxID=3457501 RepID=UPI003FD02FB0
MADRRLRVGRDGLLRLVRRTGEAAVPSARSAAPWNKGRIVGQKRPLLLKHVWSIRVRLEMADNKRDLALFNMAIDCKLRGRILVRLTVNDVYAAGRVKERASVTQGKTRKPVRFEITETTRLLLDRWINDPEMIGCEYLWPTRLHISRHRLCCTNRLKGRVPLFTDRLILRPLSWVCRAR